MIKKRFGSYIKNARLEAGIGQRELARRVGMSAPYLNDIEKSKRPAPTQATLNALKLCLEIKDDLFYDLASETKNSLPVDVEQYLLNHNEASELIRVLKNLRHTNSTLKGLKNMVVSQNYKAIIIAAGLGSRLGGLTADTPKCLLKINGRSILEHQLSVYSSAGITDISLVRGYKREKIDFPNIKYFDNPDYESNNILNSLFYAEKEICGNVVISYSDIVFEPKIVERLLCSTADISIVVDVNWRGRYKNRKDHPIEEAEIVIFDANHCLVDIGKIMTTFKDVHGEFIGMMKLSSRGAEIFSRHYKRCKELFWGKPFQRAEIFQKAYITDILKDMTELGVPIQIVIIEQGWQEIDTVEDFYNATHATSRKK